MTILAPKILNLKDSDRLEIQQLINKHNTPQQIALRAKIIVMISEGNSERSIARCLDINRHTVSLWKNRWLETESLELAVWQRLQDQERSGTPTKFSMEQVIDLFALACSPPEDYGRPISHWTARELTIQTFKKVQVLNV
ncbi:MAG: transposase [Aphanizomenon sp.]|jgi:putative transposase